WRELPVALELLEPQQLAEGQHVPVVYVGRDWRGERAHHPAASLFPVAKTRLEWIALEVYDAGHELVLGSILEAKGGFRRDRENQLPVFVAHGRWRRAVVVEEDFARGLLRFARQVVNLINAVQCRFYDAFIGPFFDLRLQIVPLGTAGDLDE